ncbi:MAG: hypothetical protein Q9163_004160 [Psora crenata]
MSQGLPSRWQSSSGGMEPKLPTSMVPSATQTFTLLDRIILHNQDLNHITSGFRTSRKAYYSDPIARARGDGSGYPTNAFAAYPAWIPGPFQYQRTPNSNQQFSPTSPRNARMSKGFRNPTKQSSDDARKSSSESANAHDDQLHNVEVLPGTQQARGQTTPPSPIVSHEKPRLVSNPWATAIYQIDEEGEALNSVQDRPFSRQQSRTFNAYNPVASKAQELRGHPRQMNPRSRSEWQPPMQMPNMVTSIKQRARFEAECKMWIGNVPLHFTQEQLYQLFQNQPGFLSVSEVKKSNSACRESDTVERGWALANFRTPEEVTKALTMLPDPGVSGGLSLVGNRYHPKILQYRHHGQNKSEDDIGQQQSNHHPVTRKSSADKVTNAQWDADGDHCAKSAPDAIHNSCEELNSANQEIQGTPDLPEEYGEEPLDCKAGEAAIASGHGGSRPEITDTSALSVPKINNTPFTSRSDLTVLPRTPVVTKNKDKSTKRKPKMGDEMPQAAPAMSECLAKSIEQGKDLSHDFPPLTASPHTFPVDVSSSGVVVVPRIAAKSFAKAASQAVRSANAEEHLLSPGKEPSRSDDQLDGSHEALVEDSGASCSQMVASRASGTVTSAQKLPTFT